MSPRVPRKTLPRKRAEKQPVFHPDATVESLLRHIHDKYTFGPAMDKRIAAILPDPNKDPMLHPPEFIQDRDGVRPLRIRTWNGDRHQISVGCRLDLDVAAYLEEGSDYIWMGTIDDYHTVFAFNKDDDCAVLLRGCQRKPSETDAREWWPNNRSVDSGEYRPHATELIDYCAKIAKHLGWKW